MIETFTDIKKEYNIFAEHISFAGAYAEDLISIISKYLYYCNKYKKCNIEFTESLEINVLYLEKILADIESIQDKIEKITLSEMQSPLSKKSNKKPFITSSQIDYDDDILADLNNPISF